MYTILSKRKRAPEVYEYEVSAPAVTRNAKPGQFIILRVDAEGERVPFTICDMDKTRGTVTILVQTVGATTFLLSKKEAGDTLADFVGPLGHPTDLSHFKKILLVGGGIGTAVIYPQAKLLKESGTPADAIIGARAKELIMYEDELKKAAHALYVMTDDGSYGEKGFVTEKLKTLLDAGAGYDAVLAVGPMPMMRAVCAVTKGYGVHTVVSMNATMVDGTGMCGCCRLNIGGETKYACVHGPEFDGQLIDWGEAMHRSRQYKGQEETHFCRVRGVEHGC